VRIGILGGTFNPPHLGHLVCAQEAYVQLGLDQLVLMPACKPPHKTVDDDPGIEHRLQMCRLAVAGDESRFEVSELEAQTPGPSYTVDTLARLRSSRRDSELFLVVGGDVAAGFASWREPERVLSLATLAVAARPGTSKARVQSVLSGVRGGESWRFFQMPEIGISSTMLRERIRRGSPTRYLMPEAVRSYVDGHRLYGGSPNP
jgi:nicotinate-nucleotide adenylyltransferase